MCITWIFAGRGPLSGLCAFDQHKFLQFCAAYHCQYFQSVTQIAKLLIVPFVCLVERFWLGKHFSQQVLACVATVILGVAVV